MKEFNSLSHLCEAAIKYEKPRVASEVRQTHLVLNGLKRLVQEGKISAQESEALAKEWDKNRTLPECYDAYCRDPETDNLWLKELELEKYVDGRVASLIKDHPAYPWFSRVKGVGGENIGKVIYAIDIERANTISALWRFCGFAPVRYCPRCEKVIQEELELCPICGCELLSQSERPTKGEKLHYSSETRSMCWRLGKSLIRAGIRQKCQNCGELSGKDKCPGCGKSMKDAVTVGISKFAQIYLKEKEFLGTRYRRDGIKVLPTPSGNWLCTACGKSSSKKVEMALCCDNQHLVRKLKEEPEGVIWLGHLDAQATRKMIKLFLGCLYLYWRKVAGLPVRPPYPIEKLGHTTLIQPEEMVDRDARTPRRRIT